ncbi:MAG TPA: hypothetical protein VG247_22940 [Pseudonocardiaceae bacterium]|jgi:hypothetical protein|nr:hypothetical protein [Pseudonocardiaceae bacterium]
MADEPAREWTRFLRPKTNPGATIYGTIVAAAIVATEGGTDASIAEIVLSVLATLIVYWLSHVYSDQLAQHATADTDEPSRPTMREIGDALREEWGVVAGGLGLVIVLVVIDLAGGSQALAVNVALACSVLELVVWGALAARRAHLGPAWVVLYTVVSAVFGVAISALRVLLH